MQEGIPFMSQIADNVKFLGTIESGFCWDELSRAYLCCTRMFLTL